MASVIVSASTTQTADGLKAAHPGAPGAHFQIPSLDGLRALSFLMVFSSHAISDNIPGGFGVTVFFFLSGYLITTLLRTELKNTGTVSLKKYYLRRVLRIFPPLYIVLAADVLLTLTHVLPGRLSLGGMLAQLLQMSNYYNIHVGSVGQPLGTGVLWSLAVEEHFYLVFPVACIILCRNVSSPRVRGMILLSICAAILVWRCVLVYMLHATVERTYYATDTRFDSILFGCVLALWGNPILDKTGPSERASKYILLPIGVGMLLCSFVVRDVGFRETFRYTLQGVALIPIFIAAIRYPRWWPLRVLNLRPIRFLGLISYTLYLVHFTIILALVCHIPGVPSQIRSAAALAMAIAIATAMYYAVEKPCAKLRRRLSA